MRCARGGREVSEVCEGQVKGRERCERSEQGVSERRVRCKRVSEKGERCARELTYMKGQTHMCAMQMSLWFCGC